MQQKTKSRVAGPRNRSVLMLETAEAQQAAGLTKSWLQWGAKTSWGEQQEVLRRRHREKSLRKNARASIPTQMGRAMTTSPLQLRQRMM